MRRLAILGALALGLLAWAFPVWLLWTTPEEPTYLQHVPALLASAESEVLVALSDLRAYPDGATDPLLRALRGARENGAAVYVLVERTSGSQAPEQREAESLLKSWGIAVRGDSPEVTLHAKFLVIDRRFVVVGSTHWTKTALTRSVQVDLVLDCPELASVFRAFFFRLWEGRAARAKLPEGPWPTPALLPLLELPDSFLHAQVLSHLLGQAQREVQLLAYQVVYYPQYPESPPTKLLAQLAQGAARGRKIQVLLEGGEGRAEVGEGNRLAAAWLWAQGAEVRLDPVGATLHAKVLLVDGQHALVTSANWNYASLAKNVEAGVLLLGTPELAGLLAQRFRELWARSRPLP